MRENKVLHVYYGERLVGTMALTESKKAAFEYDDEWLACLQTACRMRGGSYC